MLRISEKHVYHYIFIGICHVKAESAQPRNLKVTIRFPIFVGGVWGGDCGDDPLVVLSIIIIIIIMHNSAAFSLYSVLKLRTHVHFKKGNTV